MSELEQHLVEMIEIERREYLRRVEPLVARLAAIRQYETPVFSMSRAEYESLVKEEVPHASASADADPEAAG